MKTLKPGGFWFRALVVAGVLFGATGAMAQLDPGGGSGGPTNEPLNSWTFYDHTNWTSDYGYAPVSFTNITYSPLGNFSSVVVDSTNAAWLHYNVFESDGTTNFTVKNGTLTFWYAPGSWSSTNAGGTGPGEYGRLFEVGSYTPDSSYGLWSIYVDEGGNNVYFSTQTNDLSSNVWTWLATPISWTTNYFHFIALTYSATNTALYFDGVLATNGSGITVYPGPDVLTNGFYIGSDYSGVYQAHGLFNFVATYNYPLNSNDIAQIYDWEHSFYIINPFNMAMESISSAPSSPAYLTGTWDAITGAGYLQWVTNTADCITDTNVWITNMVATIEADQTMTYTFSIAGGLDGAAYDVFASGALGPAAAIGSTNGATWAWMGQGYHCNTYMLTGLPMSAAFFILGTPQDSDLDGLTDAFEKLVSHTDPNNADTDGDGVSDAIEWLQGRNPFAYGAVPDTNGVVNLDVYTPLN